VGVQRQTVRLWLEEKERALSPFAVRSSDSRGRQREESASPVRTDFQRDRDRIVHCKAFRRLKHKTQVFIAPSGDHYVTRLTHTLEVAQIARTIARALNLNEDLAEAIALGHDLGHTPFGHVGEKVLNTLSPGGFRHNEQSLRVVDLLEKEGEGLNLTWEVREGILNHSKSRGDILGEDWGVVDTLEGQVCKVAVIDASTSSMEGGLPAICMTAEIQEAASTLREFLFDRVYEPCDQMEASVRAREVVRLLYQSFVEREGRPSREGVALPDDPDQRVVDHIAGMTDQFAMRMAESLRHGDSTVHIREGHD
jgi:dGTPase